MHNRRKLTMLILAVAALLLVSAAAIQSYDLAWWTVDAGGGQSAGSGYSLDGSIAQADAGVMSGDGYTLAGGFWSETASAPPSWRLFLPRLSR